MVCCLYQTRLGVTHAHTYWQQTENIQTHRPVFIPHSFFFFRDLNLFRVELCHSASVYVQDQLCAAWVYYCISAPPPSLTSRTLTFSERIVRKEREFGAQSFGLTWYSDSNVQDFGHEIRILRKKNVLSYLLVKCV